MLGLITNEKTLAATQLQIDINKNDIHFAPSDGDSTFLPQYESQLTANQQSLSSLKVKTPTLTSAVNNDISAITNPD